MSGSKEGKRRWQEAMAVEATGGGVALGRCGEGDRVRETGGKERGYRIKYEPVSPY